MNTTGNVPGVAASKSETAVFAGADGSFGAAENSLLFDWICACTSRPTTLLYLPLFRFKWKRKKKNTHM